MDTVENEKSEATLIKTNTLREDVLSLINNGYKRGFRNGALSLLSLYVYLSLLQYHLFFKHEMLKDTLTLYRKIDDSMMEELCEWLVILKGKVTAIKFVWFNI